MIPFKCKLKLLNADLCLRFNTLDDGISEIQMEFYCIWKGQPFHTQGHYAIMSGFHIRTLAQYIENHIPPFMVLEGKEEDYKFITPYVRSFTFYIHPKYNLFPSSTEDESEEDVKNIDFSVYHQVETLTDLVIGMSAQATIPALRQFASSLHSIALWMEGKLDESRLFELPLIEAV
jgi:hypothetical protein